MMTRKPFGVFGGSLGWAMVATLLLLGIWVGPVGGQEEEGHWYINTCDWSDYLIDSFANTIGTQIVPLENCIAHQMEFKIMIYSGAIMCISCFSVPIFLLGRCIVRIFRARVHRVDPVVRQIATVVGPFVE